jgi:hypothetical protein
MKPRHDRTLAELALALATSMLLVIACGGGAGTGTDPDGAADGDQGAAVASQAAEAPGGDAGGGDLPDVADGTYSGGTAHIEVTGDKTLSVDLPLDPITSITAEDTTVLTFYTGSEPNLIHALVGFGTDSEPAFSLTSPVLFAAGGPEHGCVLEVTRNDASGLAGTFTCTDLDTMSGDGLEQPNVDVVATFTADR